MGNAHPTLKAVRALASAEHVKKLQRVIELIAQGKTQHEIGKLVGVTQGRVSQLWKEAREVAHERAAQSAQEVLDQEIQKLDVLWRQLFRAWERSQEDAEASEKTKNDKGKLVVSKQTRKGQAGDASLAGQLLKVHERLCKLKGLDVERLEVGLGLRWAGASPAEVDGQMMERLQQLVEERRAVASAGSGGGAQGSGNGNGKRT